MTEGFAVDREVDASGLNCPLPILRAKKALSELESGKVLRVIATDPGSRRDFDAFARQTGHEMLSVVEEGKKWVFLLKRR